MNWDSIRSNKPNELAVAWILLPLMTFGLVYAINPWNILLCSLGNPLFEWAVDTLQIAVRSDMIARMFFFILFTYCHMLLPTGLYYLRNNRRTAYVILLVWGIFVSPTVAKVIGYVVVHGLSNPPNSTWSYTEEKAYPNGIVVTAVVEAEEWAQDEPPRTTRNYSVKFDGKTEFVGTFNGEINKALRIGGVIVLAAHAEFSIRSSDGVWRYVHASSTAELHQQSIAFEAAQQTLINQWKGLEIVGLHPDEKAILLQEGKSKTPFCIGFDENGKNLEFRSH